MAEDSRLLEYHTFLHHSQTTLVSDSTNFVLEYHTFLHHSQTLCCFSSLRMSLEYHTFLHHSQTAYVADVRGISLSTIHFYIILKPSRIATA